LWCIILYFRAIFLEWHQDDYSVFTSHPSKTVEEVRREMELYSLLIRDDEGMVVDLKREAKGKETTEQKRSWGSMPHLFQGAGFY